VPFGLSTRVALDPGTANTLLYVKGRGLAVNEPSLVTLRADAGRIEAVGREAAAGRGRTPRRFQTARPIRGGVIRDLAIFEGMLRCFLRKSRIGGPLRRLEVAIAVPAGMAADERHALADSLRNAGAADIVPVDRLLADIRGSGLLNDESRPTMLVNIGAGVTEIAVTSRGNTLHARSIPIAGDAMDAAIAAQVLADHDLLIGEPTAERLKIELGSALPNRHELTLAVTGRCAARGIPREVTVRSGEVRHALAPILARIAAAIREALDHSPPSLVARLSETGIVLTGGSALLRHVASFVSIESGLPVITARHPLTSVIRGLADQLTNPRPGDWKHLPFSPN
jgi:rod shape-determining protein MreB